MGILFDGGEWGTKGITVPESAKDVIITAGVDGVFGANLIAKVCFLRNGKLLYTRSGCFLSDKYEEYRARGPRRSTDRKSLADVQAIGSATSVETIRKEEGGISPDTSDSLRWYKDQISDIDSPYVAGTPDTRKSMAVNEGPFDAIIERN